jgi:hypothetical protein
MLNDAMRRASSGLAAGVAALVLIGAPASGRELDMSALTALLAPRPGNQACYVRSYDAAHLRAHPHQRITTMTFLLAVKPYDPPVKSGRPEDRVYYTFDMTVLRRGDKRRLYTAGDCMGGEGIFCAVDCDGGGVALDKLPPAGALVVRLNKDGIRMFHDCDEEEGVLVTGGQDDKVFRLSKAPDKDCPTMEQAPMKNMKKSRSEGRN